MLVVLLFFTLGAGAHYLALDQAPPKRLREQELAKVERLQSRENALLKGLIDSAPEAKTVVDAPCVITQLVNTQAEKVFGYSQLNVLKGQRHSFTTGRGQYP